MYTARRFIPALFLGFVVAVVPPPAAKASHAGGRVFVLLSLPVTASVLYWLFPNFSHARYARRRGRC